MTEEDYIEINDLRTNENRKANKKDILNDYLKRYKNPFMMLTVEQVCKDLHIGLNQARDLFEQDNFPSVQIGKRKKVCLISYLCWKLDIPSD